MPGQFYVLFSSFLISLFSYTFRLCAIRSSIVSYGESYSFFVDICVLIGIAIGLLLPTPGNPWTFRQYMGFRFPTLVIFTIFSFFITFQLLPVEINAGKEGLIFIVPLLIIFPYVLFGNMQKILFNQFGNLAFYIVASDILGIVIGTAFLWLRFHVFHFSPSNLLLSEAFLGLFLFSLISKNRNFLTVLCVALGGLFYYNFQSNFFHTEFVKNKEDRIFLPYDRWDRHDWDAYVYLRSVAGGEMRRVYSSLSPNPDNSNGNVGILVKGDTFSTRILRNDGKQPSFDWLKYDLLSYGFFFGDKGSALVLGSGGGRDLVAAVAMGYRKVIGVEISPAIVRLVQGPYGSYSGGIYNGSDSRISVVVSDVRKFLSSSSEKFGIINLIYGDASFGHMREILTLKTFSFTVEAFRSYFQHLSDDGAIFIMQDIYKKNKVVDALRVAAEEIGIRSPEKHVLIVGEGKNWILFFRKPVTKIQVAFARRIENEYGHKLILQDDDSHGLKSIFERTPDPLTDYNPLGLDSDWLNSDFIRGLWIFSIAIFLLVSVSLSRIFKRKKTINLALSCIYMAGLGFLNALFQVGLVFVIFIWLKNPFIAFFVVIPLISLFSAISVGSTGYFRYNLSIDRVLFVCIAFFFSAYFLCPFIFEALVGRSTFVLVLISILFLAPIMVFSALPFPILILRLKSSNINSSDLISIDALFAALGIISIFPLTYYFGLYSFLLCCGIGYIGLLMISVGLHDKVQNS